MSATQSTITINGLTQSASSVTISSGNVSIGTSTTSSSVLIGTGSNNIIFATPPKQKYHILGEDYEIEGYYIHDYSLFNVIATLNVLGEPYWNELKKQDGFSMDSDMCKFIEDRLKARRRQDNIDKIVGKNSET